MIPKVRRSAFVVVALAAAIAVGCGGGEEVREYPLQGQILSITPDKMQASVKHEEIKGFMAAMTMDYKVKDAKEYQELQPGDLINATLVVESADGYLKDVKKVGNAPIEKAPGSSAAPASSGFELIKPGETVPDNAFLDQDGRKRDFSSFRGKTVVMTFIYTKCPMPTFCPLMDRHFATIQGKLKADPTLENVHLVTVSFDPLTDTPPVLKAHAAKLGADTARWTFLTGDRDEIDQFAARFGITVTRNVTDMTDIAHNLRTAIIDANGTLVKTYTGNEWSPEDVLADLASVAKGD
ncbi:MAG: SCO family protein [Vicinamibacterales bacterium]